MLALKTEDEHSAFRATRNKFAAGAIFFPKTVSTGSPIILPVRGFVRRPDPGFRPPEASRYGFPVVVIVVIVIVMGTPYPCRGDI